jgi:hypothetical protein
MKHPSFNILNSDFRFNIGIALYKHLIRDEQITKSFNSHSFRMDGAVLNIAFVSRFRKFGVSLQYDIKFTAL